MANSKAVATVKFFDHAKGFGFLTTPAGDVFFHYNCIEPDKPGYKGLKEGDQVEFKAVETEKGLSAVEVRTV